MAGMFDAQTEGLDKVAEKSKQGPPTDSKSEGSDDPLAGANLEMFNQHILLTAQAINRLKSGLREV